MLQNGGINGFRSDILLFLSLLCDILLKKTVNDSLAYQSRALGVRRSLETLIERNLSYLTPQHTVHIVQNALAKMGIGIMEQPSYSPDLNPIDNLLSLLKAKMYELRPNLINMRNNN